jgi:long-chain fatty acid transport protein
MKPFASNICLFAVCRLTTGFLLCLAEPASATGFYVNQQGVKSLARVGAGDAAAADELGTIFANPAGLTEIWANSDERTRTSLGLHLLIPRNRLNNVESTAVSPGTGGLFAPLSGVDERNSTGPTPIPNLYWAHSMEPDRLAVGAGINFPFGLAARFSNDWFGRYDSIESELRTVNLSVVGAYKFDSGMSLGAGIDVQYANTRLVTAIPNPLTPGGPTAATDGRAETNGQDWKAGYNFGAMFPISEWTRVGVHYRSGMKHAISGTTVISGLTAPLDVFNARIGARADLNLPAIGSIGVRHKISEDLQLLGQIDWINWSRFKEVRIRFADASPDVVREANYRDAYSAAVGAEYRVSGALTMRGGVRFDQTPTVDGFRDTSAPDSDRLWLGIGATYQKSKSSSLDVAFNQVFFRSARIALTKNFFGGTPLATSVNINGRVRTVVNTLSIDYRLAF